MKNVKTCRRCKGFFESERIVEHCPACEKSLDKQFKRVRDYVRTHKGAGIHRVSDACDIPVKQLIRWIREERLFFSEESEVALPCMRCGDLITYGEYCKPCKRKMMLDLKSVASVSSLKVDEDVRSSAFVIMGNNKDRLRKIRKVNHD